MTKGAWNWDNEQEKSGRNTWKNKELEKKVNRIERLLIKWIEDKNVEQVEEKSDLNKVYTVEKSEMEKEKVTWTVFRNNLCDIHWLLVGTIWTWSQRN